MATQKIGVDLLSIRYGDYNRVRIASSRYVLRGRQEAVHAAGDLINLACRHRAGIRKSEGPCAAVANYLGMAGSGINVVLQSVRAGLHCSAGIVSA
jgi:hypothetical protein